MPHTLTDFDYHLPEELIAQSPAHLLVLQVLLGKGQILIEDGEILAKAKLQVDTNRDNEVFLNF